MILQLIRNATLRIKYGGRRLIIDPYLAERHALPSYTGRSPNPLVALPCPAEELLDEVEMAIISHLHSDHFDRAAQEQMPKDLPLFCQAGDGDKIREMGFLNVTPIHDEVTWQGITITRISGRHGEEPEVVAQMGPVSGFVLQATGEPTLYWAGDTVWCDPVHQAIARFRPEVIITHSCGAVWGNSAPIVMDGRQTIELCGAAPESTVIATHMEALDHATVTREALRQQANQAGIDPERLLIPLDGEEIVISP